MWMWTSACELSRANVHMSNFKLVPESMLSVKFALGGVVDSAPIVLNGCAGEVLEWETPAPHLMKPEGVVSVKCGTPHVHDGPLSAPTTIFDISPTRIFVVRVSFQDVGILSRWRDGILSRWNFPAARRQSSVRQGRACSERGLCTDLYPMGSWAACPDVE